MFLTHIPNNPNSNVRCMARSVCNEFSEMIVIRNLKLVLNDNFLLAIFFLGEDVNIEIANLGFCFYQDNFVTNLISKQSEIPLLREPTGEVIGFMLPFFPEVDFL